MESNDRYSIQEHNSLNEYSLKQVRMIASTIKSMTRIVANESTLDKEKPIIGNVEYTYPKNPKKPVSSSSFYNSETGFGGGFERTDDKHPWSSGAFITANAQETYRMGLTRNFFVKELGLIFDKAALEKPQDMPLPEYHVFYFHKKIGNINVRYIFETRPDASSLKDTYPKSFHEVRIFDSSVKEK